MATKKFSRRIEDFICLHCGASVTGNGYTNHCSQCLHSRHVDVHPGDRSAECGGLMAPVGLYTKKGEQMLLHRCVVCGFERPNKVSDQDSQKALLALAKRIAESQI